MSKMGPYKCYLTGVQNEGGVSRPLLDNVQKKDAFFLWLPLACMCTDRFLDRGISLQFGLMVTGEHTQCNILLVLYSTQMKLTISLSEKYE